MAEKLKPDKDWKVYLKPDEKRSCDKPRLAHLPAYKVKTYPNHLFLLRFPQKPYLMIQRPFGMIIAYRLIFLPFS